MSKEQSLIDQARELCASHSELAREAQGQGDDIALKYHRRLVKQYRRLIEALLELEGTKNARL